MMIEIDSATERLVSEEIGKGHFHSVDELILTGIRVLRERDLLLTRPNLLTNGEEKALDFFQWAESHPSTPPLCEDDISRASLNPDRW